MSKIINKIKKNKKAILVVALFCVVFGLMMEVGVAKAAPASTPTANIFSSGVAGGVALILSWVAYIITGAVGLVTTLLIKILVDVANFNNIIDVEAVKVGWVAIRDLCNMFFILILLVIAFATILKIENYNAKKLLPKLVIMAILINFSRMICGLIIDFSQVIMLTFASSFSQGYGWFVELFRIQNLFSADTIKANITSSSSLTAWGTVVAIIAGVFAILVTFLVILAMLVVLLIRIVMLWIYTILSPIAFLASAFPAGKKYADRWWTEFIEQVMSGPILVFFIWLALTTADLSSKALSAGTLVSGTDELCVGGGAFFCNVNFQRFLLVIAFLIGGLIETQKVSGYIGVMAGKFKDAAVDVGIKAPLAMPAWGARKFAKSKYGFQVNPWEIGRGIKASWEDQKRKDLEGGKLRGKELLEKGGIRGLVGGLGAGKDWGDSYIKGFMGLKGVHEMAKTLTVGGQFWRNRLNNQRKGAEKELGELGDVFGSDEEKTAAIAQNRIELGDLEEEHRKADERISNSKALGLSTKEVKELEGRKSELENAIKGKKEETNKINQKMINTKKAELEKKISYFNDQLTKSMTPRGFEGRAAMDALINEEKSKIANIKNDAELITFLRKAMDSGDKYRAIAIMQKMAQDGNDNEWLNAFGYDSTAIGLTKFTEDQLIGKLGMNEQEALGIQSDISYINEGTNHWETARTVGARADGSLESLVKRRADGTWDDSGHAQASFAEIMKMDPQAIARALNRLAYGGERPRADGSGRDFMISTLGLMLSKALGDSAGFIEKQGPRFSINAAQNLSRRDAVEAMQKINVKSNFINLTKEKGVSTSGVRLSPDEVYRAVEKVAQELIKQREG